MAGGQSTFIAGTGVLGSDGDGGPALAATLRVAPGMACDGTRLFLAQPDVYRVRAVELVP